MPKVKILQSVEDERIVAKDIQNTLKNLDYDVPAIASTGEDAIEKAKELRPDIVLMDIVLKGEMDGIEAAKRIKNELRIPIIYLTAYEDEDTLERAKITEPLGYILKPFEERDLHTTLEMALYKHMMETKLHDSELKYRSLVELSPDGITILSENKIVFANPAAVKILGYEKESDLLNKDILSFIPESHHEIEKEKIKYISEHNSILPFVEEQYHKKDKTAVHVESALLPFNKEGKIFIQLVFRDITDRKRSEEELKKAYAELKKTQQALIQNEKLAALGRFSAGIAHEIRNPLANISASAQFCMTKYEIDSNMKRHFDVILRNTETANRIIKELLDFTSPRETLLAPGDVKEVLNHVCEMAKTRCAKQNIEMEVLIPPDLPDIRLNEKKLEEAFMNFVSNAIESMPEGGKLTVQASINDDDSIKITFKDTGCGIKHEDIDKIFEPFFTTKDDGTGLGLSLAYHIINSHSGNLYIESKINTGTKIDIILPTIKNQNFRKYLMNNLETVLIVDDNKDLQFNLSNIIGSEGYNVTAVGEGKSALREVKDKSPDLVLLDMRLPGMDGMAILEEIKKIDTNIIVIMLTAFGEVKGAVKAMKLGAFDYITKPFDNEELIIIIKKALNARSLSKEVQSLRKQLNEKKLIDDVIGESPEFKQVLKQVQIIAPTNMTVMIQGESGTGKEVICNLIHKLSSRKDKPLVAIDCGAIPDTLVESELFGHEKGAFTGADAPKTGRFEQADGGTLFLDELTNLTEVNQMKLLRVLQERKFQRLGGKKTIEVDVRIIAASNIKLYDAVEEGKFRNDLYYRLNEFHINIPLLKDRKDDIPILAKYFLEKANSELGRNIKGFSSEALKIILNYNWPGNIRELKNIIKRGVLLTESEFVTPDVLSINIYPSSNDSNIDVPEDNNSLHGATKQVEKELIKKALEQTAGNKIKAAELLKMNRKTLYRKIKALGI